MTTTATAGKTEELLQQLTVGVEKLTTSDEWVRYLDVQGPFHRYSLGNAPHRPAVSRRDASRWVSEVAGVRYHYIGDGAQLCDHLSRFLNPAHMRVASGERAIRLGEAWILLDREE